MSMNRHIQNFNDFDIESGFQEEENVIISKPFIPAKATKTVSPPPVRSSYKAPTGLSREEQLLSTVVHLDNGTTGYLITLNEATGSWSCHACYPFKVQSMSLLEEHLVSKSHLLEMGKSCFPAKNFIKACSETGLSVGVPSMISGEPIPPGMEDEVENVLARIQATLDSIFIPLIGLEFVLELIPPELNEEPRYMCALCDKRGDPRTFPNHLRSFNHHMAYLRRYFRSLANALEQLNKVSSKGFQELVFHVIGKIEEEYGRMKPVVVDASLFDIPTEKIKILRQVNNGKHIMECPEDRWMLEMIKPEYVENPKILQDKFPLKKITEKNKREQEEKQKALKAETIFNKNTRITVNKNQLRSKNDKEDSDSDIEFVDIKPSTIIRTRLRTSSKNSREKSRDRSKERRSSRKSPNRRHYRRSRSPGSRHKSRSHSKSPSISRPRSRSYTPDRRSLSRSRSRSPYYNRGSKYSSHRRRYRSRERDESYRRPISPSSSIHPMHSMSTYPSHPRMYYPTPYMPYPRPYMRFPPPGQPGYYAPEMYSANYEPHKERKSSKRKRLHHEFEKAVEEMKIEMEKKLAYHEKNPENHPMYPEEWKKFWNRRFKELQMEGKDPNKHDFKPEWILSWSKRMQELHDEDVNEKIQKLKVKILSDIDMDKSSSESPTRELSPSKDKRSTSQSKPWTGYGSEVLEKESEKNNQLINDKKSKIAGASPINSDSDDSLNELNDNNKPREKIQIENPLNVITVLRQLTVLENQLGLLAPKIVDLLSKGLVMEKIEPKSSINLLTPENCVMFETVKEKLKGQLLAGVVKKNLVNATMFSIRNIEKLMQLAPKFIPPKSLLTTTPTPAPIAVPGVGIIDKMAIAQQITQALLAQGKVDVTQEELETLINAVVGMAQSGNNLQGNKNILSSLSANEGNVLKTSTNEVDKMKEERDKKNLNHLSQVDIINLLKNFKDLTAEEQDGLITYLKDLGKKNPEEVKKLRKYIDMGPTNLKEVSSIFKDDDDDDDDNYELSEVCKAVKEKVVNEQKDQEINKMAANFEITEEQKKLLNSIQSFLPKPETKSDYSLQPTIQQVSTTIASSEPSFYNGSTNSYNYPIVDPYSAKHVQIDMFSPEPLTSVTHSTIQEQANQFSINSQEQPNHFNILSNDQPNQFSSQPPEQLHQFNTQPLDQSNLYNVPPLEQHNLYGELQEQPDPYSATQSDLFNDPYSHNQNNSYFHGSQNDSYNNYQQQNANTNSYPAPSNYFKGNDTYKSKTSYNDSYQGNKNDRNKRFGRSNNRYQNRR
ncbi:uncharacterized protein LOC126894345 isoform X2 [Daktulosphaira vitifoliae]|uniref:uncharacterized protein LOC126894345 isoform X2 n=1 Tax=Daktulosphaira vitifoliae TaxID=58002 RepID=UPI0021A99D6D|nr:uncharacterized protein LOC126894345 isoform X2 [Daktulosphaira vitifoliae]